MDKQRRPLDHYFSAARAGEGISEEEIRSIVRRDRPEDRGGRTGSRRRGLYYAGLGALALLLGVFLLELGSPADRADLPAKGLPAPAVAPRPEFPSAGIPQSTPAASAPRTMTATRPEMTDQQHMGEYRTMAINPRIRKALAGVAIASAAVATSMAQTTITIPVATEAPAVLQQAEREMAELMSDYWQAKLNGYRNTIDAMLPAGDLAELNKLRVQWGIMMAPSVDISQSVARHQTAQSSTLGADDTLGKHGSVSITIMGNTSVDVDDIDDYMDGNPEAALQFIAAFQQVKGISQRNRSGFDRLGDVVLADVDGFIAMARGRFTAFIEEHRAELGQSDEGRKLLEGREKVDEVFAMLKSEETRTMMKMVYSNGIEPLVMLYNGVGVGDFFRQAGPVASVMPGWALEGSSVLKSCVPNPASTSAAITYVLPEPSSRTRLRLFNAQGEEVVSYDLGERPAGEGIATVNVASLPAGTYLYHLTAATGKGEAVFSKTMRVVR